VSCESHVLGRERNRCLFVCQSRAYTDYPCGAESYSFLYLSFITTDRGSTAPFLTTLSPPVSLVMARYTVTIWPDPVGIRVLQARWQYPVVIFSACLPNFHRLWDPSQNSPETGRERKRSILQRVVRKQEKQKSYYIEKGVFIHYQSFKIKANKRTKPVQHLPRNVL